MTELKVYKSPKKDRWLELRKTVVTSTEMAPVAGMPKYGMTRFSVYHDKIGDLPNEFEGNERTEIGQLLENGIAKVAGSRLNARVLRLADFYVSGSMGASYDYEVAEPGHELNEWLVEVKNVDFMIFRDQWDEDEHRNPVPPEHIVVQTQHQLEVSRRPGTILAVLVGGNDLKLVKIGRDEKFGDGLRTIADAFMTAVHAGEEPQATGDDASHVMALYSAVDDGKVIDATTDADMSGKLADYMAIKHQIKNLEGDANAIKANLIQEIGDAKKVIGMEGYSVDAGYTRESEGKLITAEMIGERIGARKGFRRFTVRRKKVTG